MGIKFRFGILSVLEDQVCLELTYIRDRWMENKFTLISLSPKPAASCNVAVGDWILLYLMKRLVVYNHQCNVHGTCCEIMFYYEIKHSNKIGLCHFLRPPVHLAWWAHMNHFLSVIWTGPKIRQDYNNLYQRNLQLGLWAVSYQRQCLSQVWITRRARCQCQVAFFEPTCAIARWALMHHFLSGCHVRKNQTRKKIISRKVLKLEVWNCTTDGQTDGQTDRQTDAAKRIISLASRSIIKLVIRAGGLTSTSSCFILSVTENMRDHPQMLGFPTEEIV